MADIKELVEQLAFERRLIMDWILLALMLGVVIGLLISGMVRTSNGPGGKTPRFLGDL